MSDEMQTELQAAQARIVELEKETEELIDERELRIEQISQIAANADLPVKEPTGDPTGDCINPVADPDFVAQMDVDPFRMKGSCGGSGCVECLGTIYENDDLEADNDQF